MQISWVTPVYAEPMAAGAKSAQEISDISRALELELIAQSQKKVQLSSLEAELEKNRQALEERHRQLETMSQQLQSRELEISRLEDAIAVNSNVLQFQEKQINTAKSEIQKKQSLVDKQGSTIASQQWILTVASAVFVVTLVLLLSLFKNYQTKHALESERRILKAAEENLRLKSEFIAAVSHELRTPMNAIYGGIQIAQKSSADQVVSPLEMIDHGALEMMRLVNDVLTYTEIQSGQLILKAQSNQIADMLAQIHLRYKAYCDARNLRLQWDVDDDLPSWLIIDAEKWSTILEKLLDNAVKFTERGHIGLSIKCDRDQFPWQLVTTVDDSGIGIKPEATKSVFDPFHQNEQGFQRSYSGLGVGLAICKEFVELLDGTLTLDAVENKGTNIRVSVPVQEGEPQPIVQYEVRAATNSPILVVEDNLVNQRVMAKMLEKLGFNTVVANNGSEALKLLNEQPTSLILMDLQMPTMDGFTCTREIRKRHDLIKDTPIIAVTANLMDADKERCISAGMNDFLKKPIQLKLLSSVLSRYIHVPAGEEASTLKGGII